MGTRGAYGFRVEGVDKVTYNHWDSYPSGLGFKMVSALETASDEELLKTAVGLKMVQEDDPAPPELVEYYVTIGACDASVNVRKEDAWYCLLRNFQGVPEAMLSGAQRHAIDNHGFLADSLFCEWAYIVNMDTRVLEVYNGFNRDPNGAGRYASMPGPKPLHRYPEYYGVCLVAEINLDHIRAGKGKAFMEAIESADADDEGGDAEED